MHLPFESLNAVEVDNDLTTYAHSLIDQLKLETFIPQCEGSSRPITVVLEIHERSPESRFNSLHWEVLEIMARHNSKFEHVQLCVKRVIEGIAPLQVDYERPNIQSPSLNGGPIEKRYNILLVVSRPRGVDDIDPLLGANALYAVIAEVRKRFGTDMVRLEIVRPGTWKAFQSYLRGRTEKWWQNGGHGAWFDLVHFDVHGRVSNGCGYLDFVPTLATRTRTGILVRSGRAIAEELRRSHVDTVILHSCESAKVTGSPDTNLASTLVRSGISSVIAMSFKLTATAANMFLRAFYLKLFLSGDTPNTLEALNTARLVLLDDPDRIAKLERKVRVPDYIVPVMYSTASPTKPLWKQGVFKNALPKPFLTQTEPRRFAIDDHANNMFVAVPGRNHDVLRIEWLVLREGHSNLALVLGAPGIGKTSFLKALGAWWKETQLVERVKYWTLRTTRPRKVIRYLRAWHSTRPTNNSCLFIVDQLEQVTNVDVPPAERISERERADFLQVLNLFSDRKDPIILVSRKAEPWLQDHYQSYLLEGLTRTQCISFASSTLREIGWGHFLDEKITMSCLEYLAFVLDYSPNSINFFLRSATNFSDKYIPFRALIPPGLLIPDNPANLIFYLLADYVPLQPSIPVAEECTQQMTSLYENGNTKQRMILLILSPMPSIYCEEWYSYARESLDVIHPQQAVPTTDECMHFVQLHLIDAGWANVVQLRRPREVGKRFIRLHPAYTNALRLLWPRYLNDDTTKEDTILIKTAFARLQSFVAKNLGDFAKWRENKEEIQLQATSLLAACCLRRSLMKPTNCQAVQPSHEYHLLHVLTWAATASNTPAVPRDLIFLRSEQLLTFTEQRIKEGFQDLEIDSTIAKSEALTNTDVVLFLCDILAEQYNSKAPKKAAEMVRRIFRLLISPAARGEVWYKESRRHTISRSLNVLGHHCLTQRDYQAAKQAASLALRCYHPKGSLEAQSRNALRQIQAYDILWTASAEVPQKDVRKWKSELKWYSERLRVANGDLEALKQELGEDDFKGIQPELSQLESMGFLEDELPHDPFVTGEARKAADKRDMSVAALKAKKVGYINAIADARLKGDVALEAASYAELAQIAIHEKQWDPAGEHIKQCLQLERSETATGFGTWVLKNHYDRTPARERFYRYAHYGSVFLRLSMLSDALDCFLTAFLAHSLAGDKWPVKPADFIDWAMTLTRGILCLLVSIPRTILSPREFAELDDRAQQLLIEELRLRWPDFDMLADDTEQRLQRNFSWLHSPDIDGVESPDPSTGQGPGETVGLHFAVFYLCSQEKYPNGLKLGFIPQIERDLTEVTEVVWDADLVALAGVLGCSSEVVDENNPR